MDNYQRSTQYREGLKQGSVLSPVLFLLVMDPLFKQLQSTQLELTRNEFYAGGFFHADDIRTQATSEVSKCYSHNRQ